MIGVELARVISDYFSDNGFKVVASDPQHDYLVVRWISFYITTREILDAAPDMSFIYGSAPMLRASNDGACEAVVVYDEGENIESFYIEDPEFFSKLKSCVESDRMFSDPARWLRR